MIFGVFGREPPETGPAFRFMAQVAMLCGFAAAYGLQGEVQRAMESGCLDFVKKPCVSTGLSRTVRRVLTTETGPPPSS